MRKSTSRHLWTARRLAVGALILLTALALIGCSNPAGNDDDSSTSIIQDPVETLGSPLNRAQVPIDTLYELSWEMVQAKNVAEYNIYGFILQDGVWIADPDLLDTSGQTPVVVIDPDYMELYDEAQSARLYFDVWFGADNAANMQKAYSFDQEEWLPNLSVPLDTILLHLNLPALEVGRTYFWKLIVTDSLGHKFITGDYSFTVAPPLNYQEQPFLGRDNNGWFLYWSFSGAYDNVVTDLLFVPSATYTASTAPAYLNLVPMITPPEIVGENGSSSINPGRTAFKVYIAPTVTLAASTNYAVRVTAKKAPEKSLTTVGRVYTIRTPASLSDASYWNLQVDQDGEGAVHAYQFMNNTATTGLTLLDSDLHFSWHDVIDDHDDYTDTAGVYKLYIDTLTTPVNLVYSGTTSTASGFSLDYGTTYYLRIDAEMSHLDSGSAPFTESSPVYTFTTPSHEGGTIYTFTPDKVIPTAAADDRDPASLIRTQGGATSQSTVIQSGNPYPALSMTSDGSGSNTISTSAVASINRYRQATFQFDFKTVAKIDETPVFVLRFDNANYADTYDPDGYDRTNPSTNQGDLNGIVLALKYYADNPATATGGDPVYKLYAYRKLQDDSVDTDLVTPLTQGDGDNTDPDVEELEIANLEVYSAASPPALTSTLLDQWNTLIVSVNTLHASVHATITFNGGTPVTLDLSGYKAAAVADFDNVLFTGLNRMVLTAGAAMLVDNVSFTVDDTSYVRSIR